MKSKKVAVILSGSGVYDGAEITESVLLMTQLAKHDLEYDIFAPDMQQLHVINHLTGEEIKEPRNVLVEAARIARGNIKPLTELNSANYSGLAFPGGFGAAKNLSKFAVDGPTGVIDETTESIIKAFHSQEKPIMALCITPVLIAKSLPGASLTLGKGDDDFKALQAMGAMANLCETGSIIVDQTNKIISSPCYMHTPNLVELDQEIAKATGAFVELIN